MSNSKTKTIPLISYVAYVLTFLISFGVIGSSNDLAVGLLAGLLFWFITFVVISALTIVARNRMLYRRGDSYPLPLVHEIKDESLAIIATAYSVEMFIWSIVGYFTWITAWSNYNTTLMATVIALGIILFLSISPVISITLGMLWEAEIYWGFDDDTWRHARRRGALIGLLFGILLFVGWYLLFRYMEKH